MRVALVAAVGVALVAVAASGASSHYTKKPTDACLLRRHILLTQHSLIFTSGLGMPVTSVESFAFTGIPATAVDNGTLLFTNDSAAANRANRLYFDYYVRYDVNTLHHRRKDVIRALNAMDHVIGNVVVLWNNYPQTRAATTILRGCLR